MSYHHLWKRLVPLYGEHEAKAIARLVYEQRYALTLTDICAGKDTQLSAQQQEELDEIAQRLCNNEPVQYVLGNAFFAGRYWHVTPGVLIPRPETEQLCEWVTDICSRQPIVSGFTPTLLDIGTGSGCIAVTLALQLKEYRVTAWDVSETALTIARKNAERHQADIHFQQQDIFNASTTDDSWHVIVSNPPYICTKEKEEMHPNVLQYEPHQALFVPDDDPLRFYKTIADYARQTLIPGGMLFLENNTRYIHDVAALLQQAGMTDIQIRNDMYNRPRFLYGRQP